MFFKLSIVSTAITLGPAPSFGMVGPTLTGGTGTQPPLMKSFKVRAMTPSNASYALYALLLCGPVHAGVILPVTAGLRPFYLLGFSVGNAY